MFSAWCCCVVVLIQTRCLFPILLQYWCTYCFLFGMLYCWPLYGGYTIIDNTCFLLKLLLQLLLINCSYRCSVALLFLPWCCTAKCGLYFDTNGVCSRYCLLLLVRLCCCLGCCTNTTSCGGYTIIGNTCSCWNSCYGSCWALTVTTMVLRCSIVSTWCCTAKCGCFRYRLIVCSDTVCAIGCTYCYCLRCCTNTNLLQWLHYGDNALFCWKLMLQLLLERIQL
jgi:hypothetical protein